VEEKHILLVSVYWFVNCRPWLKSTNRLIMHSLFIGRSSAYENCALCPETYFRFLCLSGWLAVCTSYHFVTPDTRKFVCPKSDSFCFKIVVQPHTNLCVSKNIIEPSVNEMLFWRFYRASSLPITTFYFVHILVIFHLSVGLTELTSTRVSPIAYWERSSYLLSSKFPFMK